MALQQRGLLPPVTDSKTRLLMEIVRAFAAAPEHETWTVSAMARRVHVSRRALTRKLVTHTGMHPLHLLTLVRLLRATEMLRKPPFPSVNAVARATGFSDGFCLSNRMKAKTGLRPSEVRNGDGWADVLDAYLARNCRTAEPPC
jgi:transcriptional regulator GlxA family with amidase domain